MDKCKTEGCGSFALNDAPETGFCDVCLYKTPLRELLCIIHKDGGHYIVDNGILKATEDAIKIINHGN